MPLKGKESALGSKMKAAARSVDGDGDLAWDKVAEVLVAHITANSLVIGVAPPNGGPLAEGKIQ
jgi:hypothetical protein